MNLTDAQVATITAAANTILSTLGPVGTAPKSLDDEATAYVKAHLTVTVDQFNASPSLSNGSFQTAAIVLRDTGVLGQNQGGTVYDGVLLGRPTFDAANADDSAANPVAFRGTSDLAVIRKALSTGVVGHGEVTPPLECWIWKKDGIVVFAGPTERKIGGDAGAESVFVNGTGLVQVPQK